MPSLSKEVEKAQVCMLKEVENTKNWAIIGLFLLYFCLFDIVDNKQMFNSKFADDCIRTPVLWCQKQPLYQLSRVENTMV